MSSGCEGTGLVAEVGKDGALSRWALGSSVLVALAASEISGAGTIAALPIAFFVVTISAYCTLEHLPSSTPRSPRSGRSLLDFLALWLHMLATLAAAATCARVASATLDYVSDGRSRVWLFGYESHSLGEAWPDVLGLGVVVVVSAMFMLGLENSKWFCGLLVVCITGSIAFFTIVGSLHADLSFWTTDRFLPSGIQGLLTTAAMCSYGFVDVLPRPHVQYRWSRTAAYVLVPLVSYCTVAVVFTLMTHFRELTETAIPLVRVFEARDVAWARGATAAVTVAVLCLALTELCPKAYQPVVTLAGRDWKLLAKSLAYRNESTGSAVLAVFTAGSLSAILAFACPLSYLVRLLNVGPLLAHVLHAAAVIYDRYQPDTDVEDFPVYTDVGYSRLNQGGSLNKTTRKKEDPSEPTAVRGLKFGLWFLPRAVRSTTHSFLQDSSSNGTGKSRGQSEERECLLMGEYSPEYPKNLERQESNLDLELGSDGESECDVMVRGGTVEDDIESSTDIDAIVEEYKERIKVATTLTGAPAGRELRLPSLSSGRRVLILVYLICLCGLLLGAGVLFLIPALCWASLGAMFFLAALVAWQPQRPRTGHSDDVTGVAGPAGRPGGGEQGVGGTGEGGQGGQGDSCKGQGVYRVKAMPWVPAGVIAGNCVLAAELMPEVWPGVVLWIGAGLILFCRCDCWWCDCCDISGPSHLERLRLRGAPRGSIVSTLVPNIHTNHRAPGSRLSHVDTILIAR